MNLYEHISFVASKPVYDSEEFHQAFLRLQEHVGIHTNDNSTIFFSGSERYTWDHSTYKERHSIMVNYVTYELLQLSIEGMLC